MFNEYPYVNIQDVNLDWILKHIKDLETNLQDFVKLNTIKYADPIIWNITKQYETNTVVIDGNTGTAYLSVQPVPAGVALTNTDYWTVIFTLNLTTSNQNITFRDDGTNVVATFASDTGDWLLWNFYLYRVTQPIAINTAYVVGFNIERFSVELFIRDYINTLTGIIGDLDDLTTVDNSNIVNAINECINKIETMIGDLDDLTTEDNSNIVNAVNEIVANVSDISITLDDLAVRPEDFGAVGDGVTDDTQAINACLACGYNHLILFNRNSTYLVDADISLQPVDNSIINLNNCTIKCKPNANERYEIFMLDGVKNVTICNGKIIGDLDNHLGTTGEWGYAINTINNCANITVDNVDISKCWGDGICINGIDKITISNCNIHNNRRQGITVALSKNVFINNNVIHDIGGTAPGAGIDVEPDNGNVAENVIISNNTIFDCVLTVSLVDGDAPNRLKNIVVDNNILIGNDANSPISTMSGTGFNFTNNKLFGSTAKQFITILGSKHVLSGNIFKGACNSDGIFFYTANNCKFSNNEVEIVAGAVPINFFESSNNEISNNNIHDSSSDNPGLIMYFRAPTGEAARNIISSNIFKNVTATRVFGFAQNAGDNKFIHNFLSGTYEAITRGVQTNTGDDLYFNVMTDGTYATHSGNSVGQRVQNIINDTLVP